MTRKYGMSSCQAEKWQLFGEIQVKGLLFMAERLILVAEDDEAIRHALVDVLRAGGYDVLQAADGEEALGHLLAREVDLALLDLHMPKINGFKLLRIIAREYPGLPRIILSAYGEERERVKGLELGADDYVVKPFSRAELLARIAAVLRRSPVRRISGAESLLFPGGRLNPETRCAELEDGSVTVPLRDKEYELFHYLLSHPGRVISQEELLLRVWGTRSSASETRTVAVTLTRLREKVGDQVAGRIKNVRGHGYMWDAS